MGTSSYRPEIDGLRTFAVLPVVFYHVGFSAFGGGFVGVDVFFVISGYLITRLITREIEDGTFSFARFYERRARRLFPAMFVTYVLVLALSPGVFLPDYERSIATSVLFAATSLSNLYFYLTSGYFDNDVLTKPLLHTWSLSVEEQFYLVWPASLLFAWRAGKYQLVWVILMTAAALSLLASEATLSHDLRAAYFLTPFRIFEFAVGALVLWAERLPSPPTIMFEASVVAGLAMIGISVFTYSDATPFPGISALLPCLGAALSIYGGDAPIAGYVLRVRPIVGIGLISYSIYLVHWPIVCFFDAWFFRNPTLTEQCLIVVAAIAGAALMYRFVETPFRRRPQDGRRFSAPAFGLGCALLTIGLVVGASLLSSETFLGQRAKEGMNLMLRLPASLYTTPASGAHTG